MERQIRKIANASIRIRADTMIMKGQMSNKLTSTMRVYLSLLNKKTKTAEDNISNKLKSFAVKRVAPNVFNITPSKNMYNGGIQ
jgi:hypothetical protein